MGRRAALPLIVSRLRPRRVLAAALAGLLLAPRPASAHLVGVEFGDFYAGALHLIIAPEHLVSLLGLGLLAGLQSRERARWMLLALPVGLALGVGLAFLDAAALENAIRAALPLDPALAAGLAIPGLLGAAALRLPTVLLVLITAFLGLGHGYVNGLTAAEAEIDWLLFAGGVVASGTVIGTLAIALASAAAALRSWTPLAERVLSSWIAAVGVVSLGLSLAA